jgi:hypothetical protein
VSIDRKLVLKLSKLARKAKSVLSVTKFSPQTIFLAGKFGKICPLKTQGNSDRINVLNCSR